MLRVQGDAAFVVVQHREIQAVNVGNVPKLAPRGVALSGTLHLYDVGAEPGQQLRAGWSGLYVGHIEDPNSFQGFHCVLRVTVMSMRALHYDT